jgi:predicted transposase/invertase (TIGR01784 family)
MGETGDEKELTAFLNAVLGKTGKNNIKTVTILENRSHSAEIIGNKSSVLDVRAKMADGTIVNIEVQLRNVSNMGERSLFFHVFKIFLAPQNNISPFFLEKYNRIEIFCTFASLKFRL